MRPAPLLLTGSRRLARRARRPGLAPRYARAPRLADRGPAGGEALVAGVLGLAEEGLEAAQPVGGAVAGSGVGHLELEVLAEVAQSAEHGGLAQPDVGAELY